MAGPSLGSWLTYFSKLYRHQSSWNFIFTCGYFANILWELNFEFGGQPAKVSRGGSRIFCRGGGGGHDGRVQCFFLLYTVKNNGEIYGASP